MCLCAFEEKVVAFQYLYIQMLTVVYNYRNILFCILQITTATEAKNRIMRDFFPLDITTNHMVNDDGSRDIYVTLKKVFLHPKYIYALFLLKVCIVTYV